MKINFISDEDTERINNATMKEILSTAFTTETYVGGIIQVSVTGDGLNGKHALVVIDNSQTAKTSDGGGYTWLNKTQLEDLIRSLIIVRRGLDD